MLKSFFGGFRKTLYKSHFPQQSRLLIFSSRAFFAETDERYAELRHISKILGIQYFKHNREITHTGDVRLLDEGNRLLGIYNLDEARRKCEELQKDIVMTNLNARPPICKAYDYKDDLYKKFLKEVIEKDLPKFNKAREKAVESKSIKLGPKMNVADLKNKIANAQDIAKKFKTVRVYMKVTDETEESGRNVIFTFRDLGKSFLKSKGEITESAEDETAEQEVGEEGEELQTLSMEFQSLIFTAPSDLKDLGEDQLKEIIQVYVKRASKKSALSEQLDAMMAEGDPDMKAAQAEADPNGEVKTSDAVDINQDISLDTDADRFYRQVGMAPNEDGEEDPFHVAAKEEIEETRMRYGGDRDEAMYHYLVDHDHKNINRITNILKIKKLYEKKRKERK